MLLTISLVERKYCSDVMKKHFDKELVMTKKDNEDFKNSNVCWFCNNHYIDDNVRDQCHISGKHKGSAHRDCNINVKLNRQILVVFHNLKNYDSHHLMQEPGKFNLKKNLIPTELEKYRGFITNNR